MNTRIFATRTAAAAPARPAPKPKPPRLSSTTVPAGPRTTTGANLRAGPATNYAKIGGISAGRQLDIIARNPAGDWYQLASGAWIFAALVEGAPNVPIAAIIPTVAPTAPLRQQATPTATATQTAAPTATATQTAAPTATATQTAAPTATATQTAAPTATATQTAAPTATATQTAAPTATATQTAAPTAPPRQQATPTALPRQQATPTARGLPSVTASNCDCSGNKYNCTDFQPWEALACCMHCKVHDLGRDDDGNAPHVDKNTPVRPTIPPGSSIPAADVLIYVDKDATGANNGTSWTNAYTTLQAALDHTNANGSTAYEIWVAEGVYYPDEGGSHVDNRPYEYFSINWNNVQLYGGFAGNETTRDARDWTAHPTILSGDIGGDDINGDGNFIAETWNDIQGSNAYHVLYLDGVTNESITAATVLDGFTVTAGHANGAAPDERGAGLDCAGTATDRACSPTLTHVTFSGNQAAYKGGGMYNDGEYSGISSPRLNHVTFSGNSASYGGGMYNDGRSGEASPTLTDVTFSGNSANFGGGMYNDGEYSGASSPRLNHVTFISNTAVYHGGGMYNDGEYSGTSSPTLADVTFSHNSAGHGGDGMYNDGGSSGAL